MKRKVFFSFHYKPDCSRASQIRNMGVLEGNKPASDNDWESVKKGGSAAIRSWIDRQLKGRSCTVVLVGEKTAGRKWIKYEISKSWHYGKGIMGIYIHNLKDLNQKKTRKGRDPFEYIPLKVKGKKLSRIVRSYNPPFRDSKKVYAYIKKNLGKWIEEAIKVRKQY